MIGAETIQTVRIFSDYNSVITKYWKAEARVRLHRAGRYEPSQQTTPDLLPYLPAGAAASNRERDSCN